MVAYDGVNPDNSSPQTIPHSLGVKPEMMWIKSRTQAYSWFVYHKAMTADRYMRLNQADGWKISDEAFNDTEPTEEVFTVGYDNGVNNQSYPYIAYLFASVPGICDIGSYTGTGAAQDINCGFTNGARFVLIKRTNANGDWYVFDSLRGIGSGNNPYFVLNTYLRQEVSFDALDPLPSGFTVKDVGPNINTENGTYIYMAIA